MTTKLALLILVSLIIYWIGKKVISRLVSVAGKKRNVNENRIRYVSAFITILWTVCVILSTVVISGFGFSDIGLFLGSTFGLLGVALFAQWSILSNMTASVIVFFFFPYRVGDYVKIIDAEDSVEGFIKEITLFHVILIGADDSTITYPNSMVFQKAVKITLPENSKKSLAREQ